MKSLLLMLCMVLAACGDDPTAPCTKTKTTCANGVCVVTPDC